MRRLLLVFILAALLSPSVADGAGVNVFIGSPTIPTLSVTPVANLWVDSTGGTCTRQSTAAAYVDAAACSSFNAAYQAATAGDQVYVKAGAYSTQTLAVKASATIPNVVIQTTPSETVTFTSLVTDGADYVTVKGPMSGNQIRGSKCGDANFTGDPVCKESVNDVFDGITLSQNYTNAKAVDCMGGCVGTTFRNFDICCTNIEKIVNFDNWFGNSQSRDIVMEYGSVHSQTVPVCTGTAGGGCPAGDDVHTECIWGLGVHPFVLRGVHLYGCKSGSGDLTFSANGDAEVPGDITIENSIFEIALDDNGSQVASLWSLDPSTAWQGTNVIRNNLFEGGGSAPSAPASGTTVTWTNNLGAGPGCSSGTQSFNRWTNNNCGGTNTLDASALTSSRYVAAPVAGRDANSQADAALNGDWHWSSCAQTGVDAGTSTGAAPADFDGVTRPRNSLFDQGPFEC